MTVFRLVFPQQVLPNCLHTVPFSEQNVFFAGAPVLGTFFESEQYNYNIFYYLNFKGFPTEPCFGIAGSDGKPFEALLLTNNY